MCAQPAELISPILMPGPTSMPDQDRRWVLTFALLVMMFTTLPYLLGFASQGSDWRFTGFLFGVEDGNSYIAKMQSGSAGAWLFRTPYTIENQRGVVAFLPYLLLGKLAAPPGLHEQLVVLFHLFRIVAGILEILATYQFLSLFIHTRSLRRSGLALATLGGGLGWLLVITGHGDWLGSLPLDFYSPETFGFLGLFGLPHLALARAGLLWGLTAYIKALSDPMGPTAQQGLKIGLYWLLVLFAQPLTGLVMGFVLGLYWTTLAAWQAWRKIKGFKYEGIRLLKGAVLFVWVGVLAAPFILYNYLAFSRDPFLSQWTAQNIITSPHPFHYLLAYGLLIPFAIAGGRKLLKSTPWEGLLPVVWSLALPFLAYVPFNLQRRLPEGIYVALVILSVRALDRNGDLGSSKTNGRIWGLLILSLPSTLFLFSGGIIAARFLTLPVFRSVKEIAAFEYLSANAIAGQVVLTSYETGNALPAWAPVRVVVGHGPESVRLAEFLPEVEQFYTPRDSDAERQSLLQDWSVEFVFRGPQEKILGDWDPSGSGYLQPVFESGGYEVYRVHVK